MGKAFRKQRQNCCKLLASLGCMTSETLSKNKQSQEVKAHPSNPSTYRQSAVCEFKASLVHWAARDTQRNPASRDQKKKKGKTRNSQKEHLESKVLGTVKEPTTELAYFEQQHCRSGKSLRPALVTLSSKEVREMLSQYTLIPKS